jgi:hypothetical protein
MEPATISAKQSVGFALKTPGFVLVKRKAQKTRIFLLIFRRAVRKKQKAEITDRDSVVRNNKNIATVTLPL